MSRAAGDGEKSYFPEKGDVFLYVGIPYLVVAADDRKLTLECLCLKNAKIGTYKFHRRVPYFKLLGKARATEEN